MSEPAPVDLVFLWHHHQPDYRSPRDGRSELPWVRLHASKDYLDMVERLRRFPRVRATFNFVPSLLDQLDAAAAGGPDALFDLLALDVAALNPEQRAEVAYRCSMAPRRRAARSWRTRSCSRSKADSCSRGSIRSPTASPRRRARSLASCIRAPSIATD